MNYEILQNKITDNNLLQLFEGDLEPTKTPVHPGEVDAFKEWV
jgi:hypothetical protein